MRTGTAVLPLHGGRAPRWLFSRMVLLSREILGHVVAEYGPPEVLRRFSDPYWFQAFGCVLGFDWHSSGVTTTVCGAVKEAVRGSERDFGFHAAGGKGATSRKTPGEITVVSEVIYGTPISTRDPARFAFAHGGKDGHPFPVDRETYDRTIQVLRQALDKARLDRSEKTRAFRRLAEFATPQG